MQNIEANLQVTKHAWSPKLASLLPLWLFSLAIMAEGFPQPPVSIEMAFTTSALAVSIIIALLWKRVATGDLILYSLFPFLLLFIFDEISTTYKTPFIVACTTILTTGTIITQCLPTNQVRRGSVLLIIAAFTLLMAWQAASNYWIMAQELGYAQCLPDAYGCAPLTGQETLWWALFFF